MKLIFKTKSHNKEKNYLVRLPNYFDVTKVEAMLKMLKCQIPKGEVIMSHCFYGDSAMSLEERTQLDRFGKITNELIEIDAPAFICE